MDIRLLSELLLLRARWRRRDQWDAGRIAAHQERALGDLRRAAYAGSEFYRGHHAGRFDAPLAQLPPVTKADLMNNFDQTVTAPGLRLAEVEEHLRALFATGADPGLPWRGQWWAAATAGTTGRRGIFIWDRSEWATVLASLCPRQRLGGCAGWADPSAAGRNGQLPRAHASVRGGRRLLAVPVCVHAEVGRDRAAFADR